MVCSKCLAAKANIKLYCYGTGSCMAEQLGSHAFYRETISCELECNLEYGDWGFKFNLSFNACETPLLGISKYEMEIQSIYLRFFEPVYRSMGSDSGSRKVSRLSQLFVE